MHATCSPLILVACLALLACGDPVEREIARLVEGGEEAETAKMRLALAKSSAVEPLIAAFQNRSHPARARAEMAEALFQLYLREKDKRILQTLIAGLEDEDRSVRLRVAAKLGDLGQRESAGALVERLGSEPDDDVRLEILLALEIMGMKDPQGSFFDTEVGTDKLSAEERDRFTGLLVAMSRETLPDSLRLKTLEWLEIIVEEDTQEARNLELKADLEGAEKVLLAARERVPDSKNASQKLGRFYYDNDQQEKGLAILSESGMVLRPPRLAQPPRIDAVLEEPAWEGVEPLTRFYQCIHKMRAYLIEGRTEAYVGHCKNVIYIGIKGYEPTTDNLTARATERDQNAWQDDCVEIFFDFNRDYVTCYQIVVNSLGTIFDERWDGGSGSFGRSDLAWNADLEVATRVESDYWTAEFAIPIAQFERQIKPGQVWGFNMARIRIANAAEYGQWVPTYGRALRPDRFGLMLFD